MIKVNIVCIGKIKESFYREAVAEYAKRLTRFCKFNIIELAECPLQGKSDADILKVCEAEGKSILGKVKGRVVILDLGGKMVTSPELGEIIEQASNDTGEISFVIGGSYGLSDEVKRASDISLCFGKVTYPHQLMRVIVSEQIYRAFMINANSEYHK